jgi:hypothetical protein
MVSVLATSVIDLKFELNLRSITLVAHTLTITVQT